MAESRIDELRRRLDRDPGSRLFAQLAEEYRKAGNHADAIRVARSGLAQHPSYPSARLTLGRALLESGDPGGARAELEAALKEAPDNILASRFLGQALEALGLLVPALEQLQKTLKMAPGDRQLESQIVSLQTRLRSAQPAPAAAPRPVAPPPAPAPATPPPSAEPPAMPASAWAVNAPMPRPAASVAPAAEPEALPPTIRIRAPGTSGAWGHKSAAPPPLPASAVPTAATPAGPPPLPATVPPITERLPASPVYESDVAPTLPRAQGSGFGLVDETAVPTLPPGAVAAEETVLEPEPAVEPPVEPAPRAFWAEAQPRPEPRLVPEPLPPLEAPTRSEAAAPASEARPAATTAVPPGPPAGQPGQAEAGGTAGTPFPSSTLAELYLKQGLVERAVEVYRELLAEEPGNERARARLAEIERLPSPEAARAARRRALERTIAGLEALLAVVQRR